MDSVLTSIKKLLGLEEEYTQFDADIIIYINSALMMLNQLGVGPEEGFVITGATETWSDYIGEVSNLESLKTYIMINVRLMFDPPSSSVITEAFERMKKELEWRLIVQAEEVV